MKLKKIKKELLQLDKISMKEILGGKMVYIIVNGKLVMIEI